MNVIFRAMIYIGIYLSKLQLIKHLEVDLFDEISREIDGTDPCNRTEGSTTHVIDLIVAQMQSSEKTHAAKSIGIQLSDFIVAQIQDLQDGISGEGSSKTKALLDISCRRDDRNYCFFFFKLVNLFKSAIALCDMLHHPILTRSPK